MAQCGLAPVRVSCVCAERTSPKLSLFPLAFTTSDGETEDRTLFLTFVLCCGSYTTSTASLLSLFFPLVALRSLIPAGPVRHHARCVELLIIIIFARPSQQPRDDHSASAPPN